MNTVALLVIDMLNDFFRLHATLAACRNELVKSTNELTSAFRAHAQPVFWVRQEFAPDLSDAFMGMRNRGIRITIAGTDGCEILPELDRLPSETIIVKKRYSAFFGTDLDQLLAVRQPLTLVVAGINTHACIRTTAIDAYQRDLTVRIAGDCVYSYDPEHHEITRRYLDDYIAPFMTNQEIIELLRCL
ncbi:MAG: maleamate amidohydrolase [Acidobacteriota bacterium]|jgi:nicotinamidase-related amidase|nr:maleamate amidohydrolase [Acidobacteriota bacterium]